MTETRDTLSFMRGSEFVARLKAKLDLRTNAELAKRLGVSAVAVGNWSKQRTLSERQVVDLIARVVGPTGAAVVDALCTKLDVKNQNQLAPKLGMNPAGLYNWSASLALSARQIANLVASTRLASISALARDGIRPLVEFYPVTRCRARGGRNWHLFDAGHGRHPYRDGLRAELAVEHGVYVFFDSRGRAIYAGKALRLSLWSEMSNAFNRAREVQSIKRVRHPERKQRYRGSDEQSRQISRTQVPLSELAHYFSAYAVHVELIDELEALLVRSFANDLSNVRMEQFTRQRSARA